MRATGKYKAPPRETVSSPNQGVERLRVIIKGQAYISDTGVSVYLRPPHKEEEINEAFSGELEIASWSQALVLLGDFNHCSICWRDSTAQHTQSRKFPEIFDVSGEGSNKERCVAGHHFNKPGGTG